MLRDFQYLDRDLVRSFLAQVEGGTVEEITERKSATGSTGFGGKVGTPHLGAHLDKGKESSVETELVSRQVGPSEFERLYSFIDSEGLVVLDACDELDALANVRRGQFLEVDARIAYSGIHQLIGLSGLVNQMLPLMDALGETNVDDKALQAIDAFRTLGESSRVPVIARVRGEADLAIALELDAAGVLTDDLEGDSTVVLKVTRVLRKGESQVVGDLGGLLKKLPKKDLKEFLATFQGEELQQFGAGETEVKYPAIVGTALAIFR